MLLNWKVLACILTRLRCYSASRGTGWRAGLLPNSETIVSGRWAAELGLWTCWLKKCEQRLPPHEQLTLAWLCRNIKACNETINKSDSSQQPAGSPLLLLLEDYRTHVWKDALTYHNYDLCTGNNTLKPKALKQNHCLSLKKAPNMTTVISYK